MAEAIEGVARRGRAAVILGLVLIAAWLLFCGVVLWMEGWENGSRNLREFHAFVLRPWKHR